MALIVALNESVRSLANRFDTFQRNVDEKLTKVQNEQILLKSKVEFLEKNCMPSRGTSSINETTFNNYTSTSIYRAPNNNEQENNKNFLNTN